MLNCSFKFLIQFKAGKYQRIYKCTKVKVPVIVTKENPSAANHTLIMITQANLLPVSPKNQGTLGYCILAKAKNNSSIPNLSNVN